MADTQEQPQLTGDNMPGSIREAQEALLGIMEPEKVKPEEEEAAPTEEEESTEEDQDDSLEEVSEEEPEESEEEDEGDLEESAEEQEQEEDPLFTVTANGEEIEVTYDELLKGYSRQADYTRKTQEIAQQRQQYEQAKSQYESALPELANLKEQYVRVLNDTIANSVSNLDKFNIDWNRLKEEDPDQYLLQREEFRQAQDQLRDHQARKQYEEQQLQQQYASDRKKILQEETNKLVNVMPEFAEQDSRKEIIQNIREYARNNGYSEEELNTLADHRAFIMLSKAMKFDNISNSNVKAKKIKNKPKVVRSGKGKSSTKETGRQRAAQMKRLRESGHVKDATSLFEDFVDL